jgi:site-specific recombinase XerD
VTPALPASAFRPAGTSIPRHPEWDAMAKRAPQLTASMGRYLNQIGTVQRPTSVQAAENALRTLNRFLTERAPEVVSLIEISRDLFEDFTCWLAEQKGTSGKLSVSSRRQRIGMLRMFFERIIEWDWPDAPARNPVFYGDLPLRPEPLPKFLPDPDAAKLMAAARADTDPRRRLVVEMLSRTGLRAGELCDLAADAVVRIGEGHWLRVPLGKLRNDRYIPLHPELVSMLEEWSATNIEHIREHRRLMTDHRGPIDRHMVGRIVKRVARAAGIGHVHPHQLRHTLATQAINRGMRLEAIAALLGHSSMEMTLIYAKITNRTVADEYEAVSERIDALYGTQPVLPADIETLAMTKLRRESYARMLGNGLCTRPIELECRMESACETCTYFRTTVEFRPTLRRQRDHALEHGQMDRAELFEGLLRKVGGESS